MKEEEKYQKSEGYKSDEDIENLLPIDREKTLLLENRERHMDNESIYNSDLPYSIISAKDQNIGKLIMEQYISNKSSKSKKEEEDSDYKCKKTMNIITTLSFVVILIFFLIYGTVYQKLNHFHDEIKTKTYHFRICFEVFMSIWAILILILAFSFIRNSFYFTEDLHEIKEVKELITFKLKHYFYLANIFFIVTFFFWVDSFFHKYGLVIILTISTSLFYFFPYVKIKKINITGFLNTVGISISLSYLLALSNILFIMSIVKCIESYDDLVLDHINLISLILHAIMFGFAVVFLVLYKDLYYMLFIILFQTGVVVENRNEYSSENKFTFIFLIVTFVSFFFTLLCVSNKAEEKAENLETLYEDEKERAEIL